jgi:hypothetical protein
MFIQEFLRALRDFEELAAEAPDRPARGQQIIALDAIPVHGEADPDHDKPPSTRTSRLRDRVGFEPSG